MVKQRDAQALCLLPATDLHAEIAFFTSDIGFQLTALYPSDNPEIAELTGFGMRLRLDTTLDTHPPTLVICTDDNVPAQATSPGGTRVTWELFRQNAGQSVGSFDLEITTLRSSPWVKGKAGTHTRELIPSRLGGGMVATHIRIPNGGPVSDRVHYHTASFQLVYCVRGWITLVFEDQGGPITLHAGDCVTQPPHIRHKVLETSNGLEVLEIGMPAEHITAIDNDMVLPNASVNSHRLFDGQRFCHFQQLNSQWKPHRLPGFAACDLGVETASAGFAGAHVLKASSILPAYTSMHDATVLFSYVLTGSVRVDKQLLVAGDAFTSPPGELRKTGDLSDDLLVLEVSIPGDFRTRL